MLSLIILVVAGAYVGLWYLLIRALPNKWAKAAVALLALYLPFWDVPYGYYNFQKLCKSEGGLHVYAKIAPQTAVFLEPSASVSPEYMFKQGFTVVEHPVLDGQVARVFATAPSETQYVSRAALFSNYGIRSAANDDWRERRMVRRDLFAYSLKSGTSVAQKTDLRWFLWIQGLVTPMLGTGWRCPSSGEKKSLERVLLLGTER